MLTHFMVPSSWYLPILFLKYVVYWVLLDRLPWICYFFDFIFRVFRPEWGVFSRADCLAVQPTAGLLRLWLGLGFFGITIIPGVAEKE